MSFIFRLNLILALLALPAFAAGPVQQLTASPIGRTLINLTTTNAMLAYLGGSSGGGGSTNWVDSAGTNSLLAGIAKTWGIVVTNVAASSLVGSDANRSLTNVALTGDITSSGLATTLATVASAGTYRSVTVNVKGLVTAGTAPTTFSGYGLSDSSANLAAALTDETGSGLAVFNNSPTFITPTLGAASATSLALSSALTVPNGGTGAGTLTGVVLGNGTGALTAGNLSGDITTSGSSLVTTLKNTGTAGTYTSVTTDAQGRVTAGSNPSASVTFDAILGNAASSTISNGGFTNWFRSTDPGAGKINFLISGTNTTASTTFELLGQMTSATAVFHKVTESTASTGGSGSQYLNSFTTLASSTATPLHVASRGNTVFDVSYNTTQILAASGTTTVPTYGFSALSTAGLLYSSGAQVQYDSANYLNIGPTVVMQSGDSSTQLVLDTGLGKSTLGGTSSGNIVVTTAPAFAFNNGSTAILAADSSSGVTLNNSSGSAVLNTGSSVSAGIQYRNKVNNKTSGTATLSNTIVAGTAVGPGTIQGNNGASGTVTYNLPSAGGGGYPFTATVSTAQASTWVAAGSDTITVDGAVSTAGGNITSSTVGNTVRLISVASGNWIALFKQGSWTIN